MMHATITNDMGSRRIPENIFIELNLNASYSLTRTIPIWFLD